MQKMSLKWICILGTADQSKADSLFYKSFYYPYRDISK